MRKTLIARRYKILKKIGTGGTGSVYKVRDSKDNNIIALKILSKKRNSSEVVQRFKREFRLLTGLRHPNLCSVYDFGTLKDGRSYFTMEYINGKNIFMSAKGLSYEKIYPWIVQLCRVLEYIHSKGLIHYDIKPGNVLIHLATDNGDKGVVKLMDFGLAGERRIRGGTIIRGTFPYIAPEVIKGLAVDHRADLYSLGVLLYEIFTKKSLNIDDETSFATLLHQQQKRGAKLPSKIVADMPKRLEQLIVRLLSSEAAARSSRANEVIKEINKLSRSKFDLETEKTLEGYLLSSRFVGRDKEMGLLTSLYDRARHGEGKVILITGDAGIGKSRLLREFRILIQLKRSHCFTGHAYKEKTKTLEPFYEIFRELINYVAHGTKLKTSLAVLFKIFPELAIRHLKKKLPKLVPLGPEQEKLRNFEALSELIRHCAANLGEFVILLEDLHWADDLTIQFLEYLGRNITESNILICATSRSEALKQNLGFKNAVAHMSNDGYLTHIELKALKFRNLYSFLDSTITPASNSSELVQYLLKKTGGNPFFVEEIMRILLQKKRVSIGEKLATRFFRGISIPKTIEDVVLKRIDDLDKISQKVVRFAAVLLKEFNYSLMKRLTNLDDTRLSKAIWELKRRQVLIEEEGAYRFYHATLSEVLNKRLGYQLKIKLNRRVGNVLETINKRNTEQVVEDLAYYFINARNRKRGVRYGLQAAQKSRGKFANEQAIHLYKGVLSLLGNRNIKCSFDILKNSAQIEDLVGRYDDAIKHYNNALSLRTGTIEEKIKIYSGISNVYERAGVYNMQLYNYRKIIKLVKKMKPGMKKFLLKTYADVHLCKSYLIMGDYDHVHKFNFDAIKLPKDLKETQAIRLQGNIYHNMALIESAKAEYGWGDFDKASAYFNEAYKHFRQIKAYFNIASILNNLGNNYYFKSDFQKALNYYKQAVQLSEKIGFQHIISVGVYNLGNVSKDIGYYSKALNYFKKALSISKKFRFLSTTSGSLLGLGYCFLKLCNYEKAKEYFEDAARIINTLDWQYGMTYLIRYMGEMYQVKGNYTKALRFYRKALKISTNIKYHHAIALLFIDISSLFLEIGEISKAQRYIGEAMKIANTIDLREAKIDCCLVLCQTNIIIEDYKMANDYYKKGMKMAKVLGKRQQILQFFLLSAEICYHEEKYSRGMKIANKALKLAKKMGCKDLYAEALLMKAKIGVLQGSISKMEAIRIMDKAMAIAEAIGYPEVFWKIYYEYGKLFQSDEDYSKALHYYQKCIEVFKDVVGKLKNESYKKSYLDRPDRQSAMKQPSLLIPQFSKKLQND